MAKSKTTAKKPKSRVKKAPQKSPRARRATKSAGAAKSISVEDVKRMPKAPTGYEDIAFQFADALVSTKFRAPISPAKMRSMTTRGRKLGKRALALDLKFTEADRKRMAAESVAYKALLSNWRSVQALFPDRPDLASAFQFMSNWMSVHRASADAAASHPAATPKV